MALESKNLFTALRNILSKLEMMEAPGQDEESFRNLKRILNQRIQQMENSRRIPIIIPRPVKTTKNIDE